MLSSPSLEHGLTLLTPFQRGTGGSNLLRAGQGRRGGFLFVLSLGSLAVRETSYQVIKTLQQPPGEELRPLPNHESGTAISHRSEPPSTYGVVALNQHQYGVLPGVRDHQVAWGGVNQPSSEQETHTTPVLSSGGTTSVNKQPPRCSLGNTV